MSLLSYQKPHVDALVNAFTFSNAVIDSSDTGTGKTYCACGVANKLNLQPIVICPKSVITNWKRVLTQFDIVPYGISNYESIKAGKWYDFDGNKEKCPFLTVFGGEFTWTLPDNALLIFDEVHRCKNHTTQNAKLLLAAKDKCKIMMLSATIADKPKNFQVFSYLLNFCPNLKLNSLFLKKLQSISPKEPIMNLLHKRVFPRHGARIKIADLGDVFPKNLIIPDTYSMGAEVENEIKNQYEYINIAYQDAKKKEQEAGYILVQLLRARQKIEAMKIPTMIELAKDHLESGNSVVMFVNFKDSLNLLATHLDAKCLVHGDQTGEERDNAIDDFQSNKERIIVCQIQSGGVGISLHDTDGNYPRVSIISPTWSAQDLVQALGRIYRANGKSVCIQKMVYCANTIEEQICTAVQKKINNYAQLNDDEHTSKIKIV